MGRDDPAPGPTAEPDFIDFDCPYCRNVVSFPKWDAGTLKQCPNCLDSMIVPECTRRQAERIPFPIRTKRLVLRRFQTLDAKFLALHVQGFSHAVGIQRQHITRFDLNFVLGQRHIRDHQDRSLGLSRRH